MSTPWKILMYLAADNNLFNDALVSLRQTIEASRHGGAEILIQFDGPDQSTAARFRVARGRKTLVWEAPDGYTANRAKRLEHFLDWAAEEDRKIGEKGPLMVVLWGHGAGLDHIYVYETAADAAASVHIETPGVKDSLDAGDANLYVRNIQLKPIFKHFTEKIGRKIDLLALDACLMGMAEIAHEVRESVHVMVASDGDIPDASFPYREIVGEMVKNPSMDVKSVGEMIVDKYVASYDPEKDVAGCSLASLDLTASEAFATEFRSLVRALLAELGEGTTKNRIKRARDFSRTTTEPVYIDVFVFLSELAESFAEFPDVLRHAEKSRELLYILHHGSEPLDKRINSHGLSLYFPKNLDPELVAASSSITYPVQPIAPEALPKPASTGVKTPPTKPEKSVVFPGNSALPIRSYQVLWSEYLKLDFNKMTGWSALVAVFMPQVPESAASA